MDHQIDRVTDWHKSSFSGSGNCVEVGTLKVGRVGFEVGEAVVLVRDTKDRSGSRLRFTPAEWSAFIAGVRAGEFDL